MSGPDRRAWVEQVMGLPISVHLRGPRVRTRAVEERVARVFAELRAADTVFSTYRPDSVLGRLRGAPPGPAATADPLVREVAGLCEAARARTGGRFDARRLPLPLGGLGFDPSGLVKGWAVERAARHLTDLDGHDLCLNAGGDVLLRAAPDRPAWRIGIEDPDRPERMLDVVERTGGAVATSGTARRGTHITDPRAGRPAQAVRSVTVVGPDLLWADVYATAAVAGGADAPDWLATLDGYAALLVTADGRVRATPGWPGRATVSSA
ncbi:FAD:protein FMN transferase [Micromonospora sp. WMMD1128]|uniref:FAD:protein FMN transferase n=1 Tax=unclassified Micromonospora TaxID=2617518 RepID=UPI00248BF45B|nr:MULTISPECIES: FAD:protein FMN transferase [unclassified Micromonospora]WBB75297.1 FAD:protein FMN transferase [Micromonospora sp. WMMD1128]WFE31316.1 FAD:protein FMN transferase [Micromonospora sp. WMMD975]